MDISIDPWSSYWRHMTGGVEVPLIRTVLSREVRQQEMTCAIFTTLVA